MTTNLSGSLEAFPLDDVLALLGMGRRTARLEISSATATGAVCLVDGQVSAATADLSRASLLRQVVAAGAVAVSDLVAALDTAQPVRTLVERGCLDGELVTQIAHEHTVDAVGELLSWTHGEFAVWVGESDPGDVGVRIDVDDLIEQGRARVTQWERVRGCLPDDDVVLLVAPALDGPIGVEADEWSVLARIDGRRTLAQVVSAAGGAPLVACDRIAGLIGRGLVEVREPGWVPDQDQTLALLDSFEGVDGDPDSGSGGVPIVEIAVVAPDAEAALEPVSFDAQGPVDPAQLDPEPVSEQVVDQIAAGFPGSWLTPGTESEPIAVVAEVVAVDPGEPAVVAPAVAAGSAVDELSAIPVSLPLPMLERAPAPLVVEPTSVVVEPAPVDPEPVLTPAPVPAATLGAPVLPAPTPAPIAPAVEWSPWAQALGLAAPAPAGELIVDPLAGRGIAQLIADAAGLADIEHVPVPVVPLAAGGDWDDDDDAADGPSATQIVHELDLPVPGPRPAADAVSNEPAAGDAAGSRPAEEVGELRAGGLLSDLISGVRGL